MRMLGSGLMDLLRESVRPQQKSLTEILTRLGRSNGMVRTYVILTGICR